MAKNNLKDIFYKETSGYTKKFRKKFPNLIKIFNEVNNYTTNLSNMSKNIFDKYIVGPEAKSSIIQSFPGPNIPIRENNVNSNLNRLTKSFESRIKKNIQYHDYLDEYAKLNQKKSKYMSEEENKLIADKITTRIKNNLPVGDIENTDYKFINKIINLEKEYIETSTKNFYGQTITQLDTKLDNEKFANIVRKDINNTRLKIIKKITNDIGIKSTFQGTGENTKYFNDLLSNYDFAKEYYRELSRIAIPIIRLNQGLEKSSINNPLHFFKNFWSERKFYLHPELLPDVYESMIKHPNFEKAQKVDLGDFGVNKISDTSIRHYKNKLNVRLDNLVSQGKISLSKGRKSWFSTVPMGEGMLGTVVSFDVIKSGKKIPFSFRLPKLVNGMFKFDVGYRTLISPLIAIRGKYGEQQMVNNETLGLINAAKYIDGIVDDVIKRGPEQAQKTAYKLIETYMQGNKSEGNISDIAARGSIVSTTIQTLLKGKSPRRLESDLIGAKSIVNFNRARRHGAWRIFYDIETIADEADIGSQPLATLAKKNKLGVYNISLSVYDDSGKFRDAVNIWHNPKNVSIRSPSSKRIIEDLGLPYEQIASMVESRGNISKHEMLKKINEFVGKYKDINSVIIDKNGSQFDRPVLQSWFKGMGGEFLDRLSDPDATVDLDKMYRLMGSWEESNKLENLVRFTIFGGNTEAFDAYTGNRKKEILSAKFATSLDRKSLIFNKKGNLATHTAIMDNDLVNTIMNYIETSHSGNLDRGETLLREIENQRKYMPINQRLSLLNMLNRSQMFFGEAGTQKKMKFDLYYGMLSPSRLAKGISSTIDVSKFFPFGIFNSLDRQLYQVFNGMSFKSMNNSEKKAYKDTFGVHPFVAPLETEYFKNLINSTKGKIGYEKYRQRLPVTSIFFNLTQNAFTFNEGSIVTKKLTEMLNPEDIHVKKIKFDIPVDIKNAGPEFFHKNIFRFIRTKYDKIQELKIKNPNLTTEAIDKLASEETRKVLDITSRKIRTRDNFLHKDTKNLDSINKYGFDLDIFDIHFLDEKNSGVLSGIDMYLHFNQPLGVGSAIHVANTSSKSVVTSVMERMFLNRQYWKNGKLMKANEEIGIMTSPKFFSRNEFGGLLNALLSKAVWHDQHYNEGANIDKIGKVLNTTFKKHNLGVSIANASDLLAESLLKGNFSMDSISEIFKMVGLVYQDADIKNINASLNITDTVKKQILASKINDMVESAAKFADLTTFKTELAYKDYLKKQLGHFYNIKKNEAALLDYEQATGSVGIASKMAFSVSDRLKSGMKLTPHTVRLSVYEQERLKLLSPDRLEHLDALFEKFRGGKRGKYLKTLINADFAMRRFVGVSDFSKYAPDTKTIRTLEKTDLHKLMKKVSGEIYFGKPIKEITKESVEKFYNYPISDKNYTDILESIKKNKKPFHMLRDITGTIFDKKTMVEYGEVFNIKLPKRLTINVEETINDLKLHENIKQEMKSSWAKLQRDRGLKSILDIDSIMLVNPADLMDRAADVKPFHPSKLQLSSLNLMTLIDAWDGKPNEELKEEILKHYFFSWNPQMKKKTGMFGLATEVRIPGVMGQAINMFNDRTIGLVKEGKLKFGHVPINLSTFKEMMRYDKKLDITMNNLYNEYTRTTKNALDMNKWITSTFRPGEKYAIPHMSVRYPQEQNEFIPNVLFQIIEDNLKGVRPNEMNIPIDPILWKFLQGDTDKDRAAVAFDLFKTLDDMNIRTNEIRNQYYNAKGEIRNEWMEKIDNFWNKKHISPGMGDILEIDKRGNYVVRKFHEKEIIFPMEDFLGADLFSKFFSGGRNSIEKMKKLINEQASKPIIAAFSKLAIPEATTAGRQVINTIIAMAERGDSLDNANIINQLSNKFDSKVVEVIDDVLRFGQDIISLKSMQNKSDDMIVRKLEDLKLFSNMDDEIARKKMVERGYFKNTGSIMGEIAEQIKTLAQDDRRMALRKLTMDKEGGTIIDLLMGLIFKEDKELNIDAISDILGFTGTNAPTISREMAKGFWGKFKETYKNPAKNLTAAGKYAGYAALAYLGLNFFRPNQMSNKYNPLDLLVDLGPSEGFGGEEYDYFGKNYGIGRFTPLDIPKVDFDKKSRIILDDPYAEEKRELRAVSALEDFLNREDLGTISIPVNSLKKQINYYYNNQMSRVNSINIENNLRRAGAILK